MKFSQLALVIFLSVATTFVTTRMVVEQQASAPTVAQETAYARVMRTGTLRCGWLSYPNFFMRDPNTGAFSGIYYDLLEEMGHQLSLKIEWTEEVSTTNAFMGLKAGRYDVICSPLTPTPGRAREVEFTIPTAFRPYYAYARIDDQRFDSDYNKINDSAVKMVAVEGEFAQTVVKEKFPQAQLLLLPTLTDYGQDELNVAMGKADIALAEPATAEGFMSMNPGEIRQVPGASIHKVPASLLVPVGDEALKSLLNTTIETLQSAGVMQRIYEKYLGEHGHRYFLP